MRCLLKDTPFLQEEKILGRLDKDVGLYMPVLLVE